MLPAPGFLAKLTQDVQAAALEKTDGRVQVITESECAVFFHHRAVQV